MVLAAFRAHNVLGGRPQQTSENFDERYMCSRGAVLCPRSLEEARQPSHSLVDLLRRDRAER